MADIICFGVAGAVIIYTVNTALVFEDVSYRLNTGIS